MLTDFFSIHHQVISTTPTSMQRYLFAEINWENQAICILGSRGVGKTTLMCQALLKQYQHPEQALYISADNIHVTASGLFAIAREYFQHGGKALFIDEVHKYPNWSQEIKNIIDTYRQCKIVFSASSSLDLTKSKYDLSRRVIYYQLKGLSFREYLHFSKLHQTEVFDLSTILNNHVSITRHFQDMPILKYFHQYLNHGYFPFFLEGEREYNNKIMNIIEKVIFEDIAVVYNLQQSTLPVLKKILWLIATSSGLTPNIDKIAKSLRVSREVIYHCFVYLEQAGLLNNIYPQAKGLKLIRKPSKVFLENSNLLATINGKLSIDNHTGNGRETFFVNQLSVTHHITINEHADFTIDGRYVFEVGGPSKSFRQLKNQSQGFLAVDGIEVGFGKKIPLYLFGLLY